MNNIAERLGKIRDIRLEMGRKDFWTYCKLTSPDFYIDGRKHLETLCTVLQAFHENRILRKPDSVEWEICDAPDPDREVCGKLFIMLPPRHGKTRTLTKFCEWTLGSDETLKFMYTSYNDDVASDTSRYIRDGISQIKVSAGEFVFHDFFGSELQADNKAIAKWALKGQYFNFISSGRGGSVTSKGCNILIVDDPVKNAEDALNDAESERTWKWFTNTLLQRTEEGVKIILNHTRWPREDLIQRLIDKYSKTVSKPYYALSMPAYNQDTRKMLCPVMLSYKSYLEKKTLMDPDIFSANYQQEVTDTKGRLYHGFMVYHDLKKDYAIDFKELSIEGWTDYADDGDNFFASVIGWVYPTEHKTALIVKDVMFTQESVENYQSIYIDWLIANEVDRMKIESNNGGKGFALHVEEHMLTRGGNTIIDWEMNSSNKETRIRTNAGLVQTVIIFPANWKELWPVFHNHVTKYQRIGKNAFDDAPDVLTMAAEDLEGGGILVG